MDLLITNPEDEPFLRDEILRSSPTTRIETVAPGSLATQGLLDAPSPPLLAFARQILPHATPATAPSINAWVERLAATLAPLRTHPHPWRLHVWPRYGQGRAGQQRAQWIVKGLHEWLGRHHRALRRNLDPATSPFPPSHTLLQLTLTAPDLGFLSLTPAPHPHHLQPLLSTFPAGEVPVAVDKSAPSRAFAKLVEAEARLGLAIAPGQSCVDLGASPGSWSYVALRRGATVTAVDRSPLRADLMAHPRLRFHPGDAFSYHPTQPVDWLICDVIAAPRRSIQLLHHWLSNRWCRRFIVTVKFKGSADYPELDPVKHWLPTLSSAFLLTRLCANRNEVCIAGVAAHLPDTAS